jgi:hypothetical protein
VHSRQYKGCDRQTQEGNKMSKKSTAVTLAAESAGAIAERFNAVEAEARRVAEEMEGRTIARAFLGKDGVHALLTDKHGVTIEIAAGQVGLTVKETGDG